MTSSFIGASNTLYYTTSTQHSTLQCLLYTHRWQCVRCVPNLYHAIVCNATNWMIFVNFWQNAPIFCISSITKHVFPCHIQSIAFCPTSHLSRVRLNNNSLQCMNELKNMYEAGAFALIQTTRFFFFSPFFSSLICRLRSFRFFPSCLFLRVVVLFLLFLYIALWFWSLVYSFHSCCLLSFFYIHSNSFNQIVGVFVWIDCAQHIWIC